MPIAAG